MKFRLFGLAAVVLLMPGNVYAAQGDVAAGREKARACLSCHGANGVSVIPGIPSLAGQTDQFLQWQLVFFRSGRRSNPVMAPLVAGLEDADIRDLGAYFASLPRQADPVAAETPPPLRAAGEAIAAEHHCASCHMDDFLGKAAAPAIARQRADYLVKALSDYRSSARPSVGVAAMTEAASGLSDEEISALAQYLGSL